MKALPVPLTILCAGVVLLFGTVPAHAADESLRAVQATLKAKGYYYGDVTGVPDQETRDALRRCQIHEGLPVTGELDNATAKALNLVKTRPPNASPAPASGTTTALPNGAKPELARRPGAMPPAEVDREYLKQQEGATPPAARPLFQPAVRPAIPVRPLVPAPPAPTNPPSTVRNAAAASAEIDAFVRDYVAAGSGPDVFAELALYADNVNYFDSGSISRRAVLRDIQKYRREWNERSFALEGKPAILSADGQTARIRFRLNYQVRNNKNASNGRSESTMELRRTANGRFEIISIKETILPRL